MSSTPTTATPTLPGAGLRLGYLVPEFPTQTHVFFWREVLALQALGVDIHLLSTRRPGEPCGHAFAASAAAETTYVHPPSASGCIRGGIGSLSLGGYLRQLDNPPAERLGVAKLLPAAGTLASVCRAHRLDHVHVHSFASAAHVAALARRLGGAPYSLSLHGDLPVYGVSHRAKCTDAAFVCAVTRALCAQVRERLGQSIGEKCHLVRMGVDTARFTPTPETDDGVLKMVTVARLHVAKGHTYALAALDKVRQAGVAFRYHIVGGGPNHDAVAAEIRDRGLGDQVSLRGTLGEDQVLAELRQADALLLPSVGLGEAAPVAIMEAMSCGLAVVSTRIGGTPDMIADGVDGVLLEQKDVDALTATIIRLARDPAWRRSLRAGARARAERDYAAAAQARALLDLIHRSRATG
jgi:colanic acid/amylovoran biosynthesis glycosyltransferase